MKYAYVRVSTRKQIRDGNGLDEQIARLESAGFDELVVEEFTASVVKRPQFVDLISRLQVGDTLVVTKFDRLAQSVVEGSALINELLNRGVCVHILNMGIIDNTPAGKLIAQVVSAFAEYERDMIIERTQVGKEIARSKNGFRDGRPPIDQKKKDFAADLILNQRKSYNEVVELTGLSKSTVIRAVRDAKAKQILAENPLSNV